MKMDELLSKSVAREVFESLLAHWILVLFCQFYLSLPYFCTQEKLMKSACHLFFGMRDTSLIVVLRQIDSCELLKKGICFPKSIDFNKTKSHLGTI